MSKIELKPCRCGYEEFHVLRYRVGWLRYYCRIGCLSWDCDRSEGRRGLTKKQAERRARRAWNRRAGK